MFWWVKLSIAQAPVLFFLLSEMWGRRASPIHHPQERDRRERIYAFKTIATLEPLYTSAYSCRSPNLLSSPHDAERTMPEAVFTRDRHITYFLRCLKTFLPGLYTPNDSNRILLAFFIVSGLDLLGVLQSKTTPEERQGYIEWIYHCQVPSGGFRGFTGTDFGAERRTQENEAWDPANVPSTFFALVILLILGDDLARVKRIACLHWLPKMQRSNGSFGEVLGPGGQIEGGGDLRFCCFAAGTRYILRGKRGAGLEGVPDINVGKLVAFIESCQVRISFFLN